MTKQDNGIHFLNEVEYKLYNFFIKLYLNHQTFVFDKGQKVLAKILRCHENSIGPAIKSFVELGWLQKERIGKRFALRFTLPEEDLQCRLNFISDVNYASFSDLQTRADLRKLKQQCAFNLEKLSEEVQMLQANQAKQQVKNERKPLPKEIVADFVDRLLVRLNDPLDQRSMSDKVLTEINALKKRLANDSPNASSPPKNATSYSDYDVKSSNMHAGIEEIAMKFKNK
jgi:hypothetical protein